MANLSDTAQMTMDLYYQNYKTDEDFFTFAHFVYLCGVAYSKILEDEYKEARKEARADALLADIFIGEDWLIEETLPMTRLETDHGAWTSAPLKKPVFSFPYDPYSFGIQSVVAVGPTTCRQFLRTSQRDNWMDCLMPKTRQPYFYVAGNRLVVKNMTCSLEKGVTILMVPDITQVAFGASGGPVPGAKEDLIIRKTLEILLKAREGVVVDMTNNSNPNKVLQTEVDAIVKQ